MQEGSGSLHVSVSLSRTGQVRKESFSQRETRQRLFWVKGTISSSLRSRFRRVSAHAASPDACSGIARDHSLAKLHKVCNECLQPKQSRAI